MTVSDGMSEPRCVFCGLKDSSPFLRHKLSWREVNGRMVCGDDCETRERARQEEVVEELPVRTCVQELSTIDDFLEALGGHGQDPDDIANRVKAFDRAALRAYISACSEEYDCSGWGMGFPEALWRQMCGSSVAVASAQRASVALELAQRAGGWWHYSEGAGRPVFVETAEWERIVAAQ